jgi:transcriptional regulator with XRE-family HTH domain
MGIDRSAIAKWETGAAMPRADKLTELAKILGCTVDELLIDGEEAECNDNSRD